MRALARKVPPVALLVLILLAARSTPLSADSQNASWLLFEQGNAAAVQREYGTALQLYKNAIEAAGIFPEAEAAIGDVYVAESELALAQKQYEKAYNLRKSFYIPDLQYDLLYKLANLFELQGNYGRMEESLLSVVDADRRFFDTANQRLRAQVESNYKDKGLDRVLVLYNFDDTPATAAHSKLGWLYYRLGRYDQSKSHLLYSVVYRVSQVERWLRERDVDWEYSNLSELLRAIDSAADLRAYANSVGLYKDLYYLAGSVHESLPAHATYLWRALAAVPSAGQYRELSVRQLKKPFVEPLLRVVP